MRPRESASRPHKSYNRDAIGLLAVRATTFLAISLSFTVLLAARSPLHACGETGFLSRLMSSRNGVTAFQKIAAGGGPDRFLRGMYPSECLKAFPGGVELGEPAAFLLDQIIFDAAHAFGCREDAFPIGRAFSE